MKGGAVLAWEDDTPAGLLTGCYLPAPWPQLLISHSLQKKRGSEVLQWVIKYLCNQYIRVVELLLQLIYFTPTQPGRLVVNKFIFTVCQEEFKYYSLSPTVYCILLWRYFFFNEIQWVYIESNLKKWNCLKTKKRSACWKEGMWNEDEYKERTSDSSHSLQLLLITLFNQKRVYGIQ